MVKVNTIFIQILKMDVTLTLDSITFILYELFIELAIYFCMKLFLCH